MFKYLLLSFGLMALPVTLTSQLSSNCSGSSTPKVLLAGDSWAQFMGDDGTFDEVFDAYGFSDCYLVTETLGSSPGSGYTGSAYAVSGSEAREWVNTNNYPYIENMVEALEDNPTIETVVLSIGGNDILAGKSGGGWYKDMDLDVAGSEQDLFDVVKANTLTIINAALDVRPDINVIISSYEYPNFDVEFGTCWIYACDKRDDLSRDPNNDLITNAELNGMMVGVETQRQDMVDNTNRVFYDNSVGLMHHVYGDGVSGPGNLPAPEAQTPYDPGGNPLLPTLRENFRIIGDPIHLDEDGYVYKVQNQFDNYFFSRFWETPDEVLFSEGGNLDGWVDVVDDETGTNGIRMGDDGSLFGGTTNDWRGILSFDTGSLPNNAMITGARLYLTRSSAGGGTNPYNLGDRSPRLDIKVGSFGNPAVELSDGTATASANDVGCFHGSVNENLHVNRIDIDPAYLSYINTSGRTQFRLLFTVADWSDNYVNYYDGDEQGLTQNGDSSSGKDRADIIFQEKTVTVEEEDGTSNQITFEVPVKALKSLPDVVGTTAPFLNLTYELVLPVDLLHFTAVEQDGRSHLNWSTASEEHFAGFQMERSVDAKNWQKIGYVAGHGNTQQQQGYQFVDPFPLVGENYYRLNMLDQDDSQAFSEVRRLHFDKVDEVIQVYPNPFVDHLALQLKEELTEEVNIQLHDVLGRTVQHWTYDQLDSGIHSLTVDNNLPAGSYWLTIISAGKTNSLQLIRQR